MHTVKYTYTEYLYKVNTRVDIRDGNSCILSLVEPICLSRRGDSFQCIAYGCFQQHCGFVPLVRELSKDFYSVPVYAPIVILEGVISISVTHCGCVLYGHCLLLEAT